jgi:nucleotide-binding universal stress UspA family protein
MLAEQFESELDAIYVSEGHDSRTTRLFAPRVHAVEKSMVAQNLAADLTSLIRACAPRVPSTAEVLWGRPLHSVLAEASRRRSDLIVVGASGQPTSWRCATRFADTLAFDAPCPVLTVPDRDSFEKPSRILLGIDFSEASDAAVEWTAMLASRFDASVQVLHAERGLVRAPSELGKIECHFGRSGVRATMRAARGASLLADVIGQSSDDPFELVVIGAERGSAARLDTSFVERLRRLVRTPVLSIVAKAESQPMPSPDPIVRLRDLLPFALEPVARPYAQTKIVPLADLAAH